MKNELGFSKTYDKISPVYFQKLAKSEEEDIVGNYFKQQNRASRIVAQARETKRHAGMHKGLNFLSHVW